VLTNYKAPKYKLVKINVNSMDIGNWRDILPERKDVLMGCAIVNNRIIANYIVDAKSQAEVYTLDGTKVADIELPTLGTISGVSGEINDSIAFYSFSSFTGTPNCYQV